MVDSAASPVDGPTKLEQRQAADVAPSDVTTISNDDRYNSPTERQAQNVRDYHQSEIDRLTRAIEQHQAIVDAQDEILNHPSSRGREGDGDGVENGTDINAMFNRDPSSPDGDAEANVDTPSDLDSTPATPATDAETADAAGGDNTGGAPGRTPDPTGADRNVTEDDKSNPTKTRKGK